MGHDDTSIAALLMTIFGVLLAASVLLGRAIDRLGVPVVLVFLVLGMVSGSEGLGLPFEDYSLALRMGILALVFILFDGGLNTKWSTLRAAIAPASMLATVGVAVTAAITAAGARLAGLPWPSALLLGAVVSSTDAATVFSVLRGSGLQLKPRVGRTLELESGINDPMAVILTTALTQATLTDHPLSWSIAWLVALQLAVGTAVGLLVGYAGTRLVTLIRLRVVGLYPALTFAVALIAFGLATLLQGSGFLAVYIAAVMLGNIELPYDQGLRRIHDAAAWLAQIGMFLMLGLLVFPSQLLPVAWKGLLVAVALTFVARPVAAWLCLWPFGFSKREIGYVGWVGLRGAVPIILATIPHVAHAPDGLLIFNIVFFIVVINALVPGATLGWVTRRLGMGRKEPPAPSAVLEIMSSGSLEGEVLSFLIDESLAVVSVPLARIRFPSDAAIVLVIRGERLIAGRGTTVLQPGDHVYVACRREDRPYVELLFGRPENA